MKVCWITVCCSQCGSQGDSLGESQCDSQTNLVRALVLATNIYNWKKTDLEFKRLEKTDLEINIFGK